MAQNLWSGSVARTGRGRVQAFIAMWVGLIVSLAALLMSTEAAETARTVLLRIAGLSPGLLFETFTFITIFLFFLLLFFFFLRIFRISQAFFYFTCPARTKDY